MCGICGIIYDDPARRVESAILETMNRTMTHRGPDDEGSYIKGPVGIAMRRLAIIDLQKGHQPISNEDGSVQVVLNGEIYNYEELREQLESKGHIFKTRSDVEVTAHLYEENGLKLFDKLNGMFGLAIWDERQKTLLLARDRMGKKPLYYAKCDNMFLFASELKAIIAHPEFDRTINNYALAKYLAYEYIPAPQSIFKNIYKLEAGHYLLYQNNKIKTAQYWDIPVDEFKNITVKDACSTLEDLLAKAVKRRLMSDVPLGVFLSGGIDSSIMACLMSRFLPAKKLKTFSIAFQEKSFDESSYAKSVALHFGTDHYEKICTPHDLINLLPEIQAFMDEPIGDSSIVPTYALSKFTRQHVTVALGGDGGDELFAGYPTFQAEKLAKIYRVLPSLFRSHLIEPVLKSLPVSDNNISLDFKIKQFIKGASIEYPLRHFIWMGSFSKPELKKLLASPIESDPFEDVAHFSNAARKCSAGNALLYIYKKLYLNEDILVKVDRASMGCSLEVRAPFLDHHVVEFVSRLPYNMKLKGFTTKYLLKKTFGGFLPEGIANRPKKGFGVPVAKWIKGPLKEMAQDILNPSKIKREAIFDSNEVQKLLNDHLGGKADNRKKLWTLLAFELWYDKWGRGD